MCHKNGFKQHLSECWCDSIQQFFCFQDEIKEQVQRKLLFLTVNEIFELAESRGRKVYLPISLQTNIGTYNDIISRLKKFISLFQKRFKLYYEFQFKEKSEGSGLIKSRFQTYLPENLARYELKLSVESAIIGKKLISIHSYATYDSHGGYVEDSISLYILLSYCLLDEGILSVNYKSINNISNKDIHNVIAFDATSEGKAYSSLHSSLFYKCNGIERYYNDNINDMIVEFNYTKFLSNKVILINKYRKDNDLTDDYIIDNNANTQSIKNKILRGDVSGLLK